MNKQIDDIRKKYGEPMLRMAIDHIIGVGTNNLKNVNADEVCARILKETPANSIMTPEFSAELMRCAIELSQIAIGDILKYIQTDMRYDGVTVHPGIIIRFRQNATCHNIMTCVIPADTDEETLEEAVKTVEDALDRTLLVMMVDHIDVFEENRFKVFFKYQNQYEIAKNYIAEKLNKEE